MTLALDDILLGSRLIPFSSTELRAAIEAVKVRRKKGSDLSVGHPVMNVNGSGVLEGANNGILFFHSPQQLQVAFLFVKLDAGRGLLGGQKAVFGSYISADLHEDDWGVGPVFKMWGIAVTSMGNVYRGNGFA
jgi:hypothetical protein